MSCALISVLKKHNLDSLEQVLDSYWLFAAVRVFLALSHDLTASILHFSSGFFSFAPNSCCMSKAWHTAFLTSFFCYWHINSYFWPASDISCLLGLPAETIPPVCFAALCMAGTHLKYQLSLFAASLHNYLWLQCLFHLKTTDVRSNNDCKGSSNFIIHLPYIPCLFVPKLLKYALRAQVIIFNFSIPPVSRNCYGVEFS